MLTGAAKPGPHRVVCVDGMAGVGKTVLALQAAHRLVGRFPDGQFFVDLQAHHPVERPVDVVTALRVLLVQAGVAPAGIPDGVGEAAALWRRHTAGARMLVVLDNAASADQIRPLLPVGADCLTLVTSRRRLTLTEPIPARVLSLDRLPRKHGRTLFLAALGDRHPAPVSAEVDRVLELCGDLPLATCAAAIRLRARPAWSMSYLTQRLADPTRCLVELQTDDGDLGTCFHASFRYLRPDQQRLLAALSRRPHGPAGLFATTEAMGVPAAALEQVLDELVGEHLLENPEPGCYEMHRLVRVFCATTICPGCDTGTGRPPREPLAA